MGNSIVRRIKSENGVALMVVLILSAVALALMTALIYMITAGTQISGLQRRYKTALEAGRGGSEVFYDVIAIRGDLADQGAFIQTLNGAGLNSSVVTSPSCSGTSSGGTPYPGFAAKLMTPTASWINCGDQSLSIDPANQATYDMKMELGANKYDYYAKIVSTVEGNTGPDGAGGTTLLNKGVVSSGTGEIAVMQKPYLYAIEAVAVNGQNPNERAKFSILYQY